VSCAPTLRNSQNLQQHYAQISHTEFDPNRGKTKSGKYRQKFFFAQITAWLSVRRLFWG